jgi:hypothetical protein
MKECVEGRGVEFPCSLIENGCYGSLLTICRLLVHKAKLRHVDNSDKRVLNYSVSCPVVEWLFKLNHQDSFIKEVTFRIFAKSLLVT